MTCCQRQSERADYTLPALLPKGRTQLLNDAQICNRVCHNIGCLCAAFDHAGDTCFLMQPVCEHRPKLCVCCNVPMLLRPRGVTQ